MSCMAKTQSYLSMESSNIYMRAREWKMTQNRDINFLLPLADDWHLSYSQPFELYQTAYSFINGLWKTDFYNAYP